MKNAVKKAATATKKAVKKAVTVAEGKGKQGRVSAYAGLKITKLVKVEDTKLRQTGFVRDCWDLISNGIKFETWRASTPDPLKARKVLADFIEKGYVSVG